MQMIEQLMYQLSDLFLAPVLLLLVALFIYSLMALGGFAWQWWQRRQRAASYQQARVSFAAMKQVAVLKGYSLSCLVQLGLQIDPAAVPSKDQLDVAALRELEGVRTVSRLAPMLGLIATMVPMGPALKSLADGNVQGISENLIVAFSAVIFGLVIASITFWIATIRKRWLVTELVDLTPLLAASTSTERSE